MIVLLLEIHISFDLEICLMSTYACEISYPTCSLRQSQIVLEVQARKATKGMSSKATRLQME